MSPDNGVTAALKAVVAIRNGAGQVIGTGVVVAKETVLTALHVVHGEAGSTLTVAGWPAIDSVVTLPTWRYGRGRKVARMSHLRSCVLTGIDSDTVDLALLTVPNLDAPAVAVRHEPVRLGERVAVAGYPNGRWTVSLGPVTSADQADYIAHVLLGPGASGAPAMDSMGRVCGVLTMDHLTAGAILIGPQLLTAFTDKAGRMTPHHAQPCLWCSPADDGGESSRS
ncbi:MAG: putative serine protease do-like protein [Pseudonocardia sp.]|nr:putative serine protease do-like protein [Pseudonocardia sp.]